jgi:hypothetical protein
MNKPEVDPFNHRQRITEVIEFLLKMDNAIYVGESIRCKQKALLMLKAMQNDIDKNKTTKSSI